MLRRDLVMFACGLLCGAMLVGTAVGESRTTASVYQTRYKKLDLFSSVLSYIENDYVEKVNGNQLIYGAIHGMLKKLDPYTVFIPPRQYQEMKSETSGEYGGPGLSVALKGKYVEILYPVEGSPAEKVGIRAGDLLTHINGRSLQGVDLFQVRRWLRGRPGTKVKLTLYRKGWKFSKNHTLIREQIRLNSVSHQMVEKGFPWIRIKSFQDRTEQHLKEALEKIQSKGPIQGMILDLRNNPGGLFDQSVRVADLFLRKGTIVVARGRGANKVEREKAHEKHTMPKFPIVVLVNRGTASAAEIVSGALQDHRRALMLGEFTFGKGSVQTIIDLADGSGLKMTIARYYTPLGRLIHKKGIQPDVRLEGNSSSDRQMKAALRLLKNKALYKKFLGRGLPLSLQKKFPTTTTKKRTRRTSR